MYERSRGLEYVPYSRTRLCIVGLLQQLCQALRRNSVFVAVKLLEHYWG